MKKEGKANLKLIISVLFFSLVMLFTVYAVNVNLQSPADNSINITQPRNINFTFNVTWSQAGEVMGNCSVWTNFTGVWESLVENGSQTSTGTNITNGTQNNGDTGFSLINYTFSR